MHVHLGGDWVVGHLDATPGPDDVRLDVVRQVALAPVDDQYFERRADAALLLSYLRNLGPRRVLRKVVSRRAEAGRNDAWLSVGLARDGTGAARWFVAPSGPAASERVVLHRALTHPARVAVPDEPLHRAAAHDRWRGVADPVRVALEQVAGWRPEAAAVPELGTEVWEAVGSIVSGPPAGHAPFAPRPPASEVRERIEATGPEPADRPAFHVFGYGQYAKTQVIPNLGSRLVLRGVHEIDPLQLGPVGAVTGDGPARPGFDTSGRPRPTEQIDNAVVAGYHHTHVPVAVELLDAGARHVVIEKPTATSVEQVDDLVAALARNPDGRVHVAFQRRHSPFNHLLREDLGEGPISMAATVYEVPLPERHWYRWPIVGNEVVSNGCHWIDHFLHLNPGAEVVDLLARRLRSQALLGIDLDNGASFSLSLRHQGAPRRGVRDLCTFWRDDASAVIEDQRTYRAERGYRALRTRTTHPYRALELMYADFAHRIVEDRPGDPVGPLRRSALTTLELARLLGPS